MSESDGEIIQGKAPQVLTVVFHEPIVLGSLTYSELRFRELTAGQYKQMSQWNGVEATINGLAMSAGVAPAIIQLMPVSLFADAERFVGGFFAGSQTTGLGG